MLRRCLEGIAGVCLRSDVCFTLQYILCGLIGSGSDISDDVVQTRLGPFVIEGRTGPR